MHALNLPDDIVLRVFSFISPFSYAAWCEARQVRAGEPVRVGNRKPPAARALAFSQISRSWRDLALGDPRLWSFVDCRCLLLALEILRRVGDAPTDVRWDQSGSGPGPETLSAKTLSVIRKRAHFVRTLHLEGSLASVPLFDFLCNLPPLPHNRLHALCIRLKADYSHPRTPLPLRQFLLGIPGPLGLTHLELKLKRSWLAYDNLLLILAASPRLVCLTLDDVLRSQVPPSSWSNGDSGLIRLGQLQEIVLADVHQMMRSLLQFLDITALCSVSLRHRAQRDRVEFVAEVDDPLAVIVEELRSVAVAFKYLSVECQALSFWETECSSHYPRGSLTFQVWGTGQLEGRDGQPERRNSHLLQVCDSHPDWRHFVLPLDDVIPLVMHSLSVSTVTHLAVHGIGINIHKANPIGTHPPSVRAWVDILLAMPLLASIVVTEWPARTLLQALVEDHDHCLVPALHTLVMSDAFLSQYGSTPTSVILETALRARESSGHPILLVKLHQCDVSVDLLAFEVVAEGRAFRTRVIWMDNGYIAENAAPTESTSCHRGYQSSSAHTLSQARWASPSPSLRRIQSELPSSSPRRLVHNTRSPLLSVRSPVFATRSRSAGRVPMARMHRGLILMYLQSIYLVYKRCRTRLITQSAHHPMKRPKLRRSHASNWRRIPYSFHVTATKIARIRTLHLVLRMQRGLLLSPN